MSKYKNIGYVFTDAFDKTAAIALEKQYGLIDIKKNEDIAIDLLIVIGGDGFMLHSLHNYVVNKCNNVPVYGINYGTIGFLLNQYSEYNLIDRINEAIPTQLTILNMVATDTDKKQYNAIAINEVSLFRSTHQATNLQIKINSKLVMEKLVSDGVLVATPAGSTAYNFSAGGSILPLNSNVFSLTAINSFRPRRWRGAILTNSTIIEIDVINPKVRSVAAVADYTEFRNITNIKIKKDTDTTITLLFDKERNLEERITNEQFSA
ncbi:ATP-NAD kinase family protein [Ehrlichia chaffeensis str. Heartland]|uniref:NAD kinase n=1 Tax=Ehrlichia chaffeensis (strain ATCC CRL-10679 / Arkansas) TaxID=205920 RepID=Q2GHN7_EHRCR|nr:NAD kinase [Ehrlichia chaffeensis]ABD45580.1 putative ATP-NAD kinase [Ehrlichia chaffeensis str. Arkansas]AHX03358.1 ATP-NAD kinase family protein [Ehrlichia chaffeensis str. Heartland]AHX05923.1 ATP-NAD kinase family protein [Ehrlichia chaffeensis str. Jax]AHX06913.1 ATP-NAD kinase family protein [Ehrlichia chaffeensis str. Liberty]AHX07755.1 ATP-NAD kinase family protein [Ehrlichia chaffeensis str. Osceola]